MHIRFLYLKSNGIYYRFSPFRKREKLFLFFTLAASEIPFAFAEKKRKIGLYLSEWRICVCVEVFFFYLFMFI